jgi:hypothetical protein
LISLSVTPGAFCAEAGRLSPLVHRASKTIIPLRINVLPMFQRLLLPQSHFSSASRYPVRGKG